MLIIIRGEFEVTEEPNVPLRSRPDVGGIKITMP